MREDLRTHPNLGERFSTARMDTPLLIEWRRTSFGAWGVGVVAVIIAVARDYSLSDAVLTFLLFVGVAQLGRYTVVVPMLTHHAESAAYSKHVRWVGIQVLLAPFLLFGPFPEWLEFLACAALMLNQLLAVRAITGHAMYGEVYPPTDRWQVEIAEVRQLLDSYRKQEPFSPAKTIGLAVAGFAIGLSVVYLTSTFRRDANDMTALTPDALFGLAKLVAIGIAVFMALMRARLLDALALVAHDPPLAQ